MDGVAVALPRQSYCSLIGLCCAAWLQLHSNIITGHSGAARSRNIRRPQRVFRVVQLRENDSLGNATAMLSIIARAQAGLDLLLYRMAEISTVFEGLLTHAFVH